MPGAAERSPAAGPASATSPPRGFTTEQWTALDRDHRRQLVHALLIEAGASYASTEQRAAYDDLVFIAAPLLGRRRMRVRVMHRAATGGDLSTLAERAAREELADYLLLGCAGDDDHLAAEDHYLSAEEIIELLEASAVIVWPDGRPRADRESFVALQAGAAELETLDTLGLRALAPLSRNKLPWSMRVSGVTGAADDWFERVFFRAATAGCGLAGRRFGSAQRAQRVADGVLHRHGQTSAVLYDCKAARDGYKMTADHERRLLEYARSPIEHDRVTLSIGRVVIISSGFPGDGGRHPFHARRDAFRRENVDLAYVRAADVVAAALALRPALDVDTAPATAVAWCDALDEGLVTRTALLDVVAAGVP